MSNSTQEITRSRKAYITGFVLSLALTLTAFYLVGQNLLTKNGLVAVVSVLALLQFVVQMYFFLHLGQEEKPRLKLLAFWFILGVALILVIGSIWIMANLNYNMTPQAVTQYLNTQN